MRPTQEEIQTEIAERERTSTHELANLLAMLKDEFGFKDDYLGQMVRVYAKGLQRNLDAIRSAPPEALRIAQLEAQVEAARGIINGGVDIMENFQVGQWAGVREWLERDTDTYVPSPRGKQ